jgi:hypothetical protein
LVKKVIDALHTVRQATAQTLDLVKNTCQGLISSLDLLQSLAVKVEHN